MFFIQKERVTQFRIYFLGPYISTSQVILNVKSEVIYRIGSESIHMNLTLVPQPTKNNLLWYIGIYQVLGVKLLY